MKFFIIQMIAHPKFNLDFIFLSALISNHPKMSAQKTINKVKNSNTLMNKLYRFTA